MKNGLLLFLLIHYVSSTLIGQSERSNIIHEVIESKSLGNNPGGEDVSRHIAIYLPPGYQNTTTRYPVIYWAHGFGRTPADSIFYEMDRWQGLMDKAIAKKVISPTIMVFVDNTTLFWGSNYANSELTGNWESLMAKEVVKHIDSRYKTIAASRSRGIAGFSMGGYGALRLAMRNPNVYGAVYGHSPAIGAMTHSFSLANTRSFSIAAKAKSRDDLSQDFMAKAIIAYGRTFTPNLKNPPFYCDLPVSFENDEMVIHDDVLRIWHQNTLVELIDENINGLRKLKGIKFDWGRYDIPYIAASCPTFTNKLLSYGIKHYAEEYNGGHGIPKFTDDGPYLTEMLPFFMEYLSFE